MLHLAGVDGIEPGGGPVTLRIVLTISEFGVLEKDPLSVPMPCRSRPSNRYGMVGAEGARHSPIDLHRMGLCG